MNHWFRFYSEFSSDPKVQSMTEPMQRRLVMLFCLRCGDVLVTFEEQDLAFALRVTEQELADTKELFIRKGFIDDTWRLCNWDKRQYVSDSSTERTRAYRERIRTSQKRHSDGADTEQIQNRTDTDSEKKSLSAPAKPSPNGTRFDFPEIPADWERFCISLEWDQTRIGSVFDSFGDYWRAQPGTKGRKSDWLATWRNWCRKEDERLPFLNGRAKKRIPNYRAGELE